MDLRRIDIVFLSLFIHGSVAGKGAYEIIVDSHGLRPVDSRKLYHGGDGRLAILTDEAKRLERGLDKACDYLWFVLDEAIRKASP